ncbi:hypothetical protein T439DRAFT_321926 [Meredithblackwellia eburnea MCA 4105]
MSAERLLLLGKEPSASLKQLEKIRDVLVKQSRACKAKSSPSASSTSAVLPLQDYERTFSLVHDHLDPSGGTQVTLLSLQVAEVLLSISNSSDQLDSPELQALYTTPFFQHLATHIYKIWISTVVAVQVRCRAVTVALIALDKTVARRRGDGETVVPLLKKNLLVDPWLSKRSMFVFEVLIETAEELIVFKEFQEGTGGVEAGVWRKITAVVIVSDELATTAGKVASTWLEKVQTLSKAQIGPDLGDFWLDPVLEGLSASSNSRNNLRLYLLPLLFKHRPGSLSVLINSPNFFNQSSSVEKLDASLSILSAANAVNLISTPAPANSKEAENRAERPTRPTAEEANSPMSSNNLQHPMPFDLLAVTLTHSSPTLRLSSALLLVDTFATATLMTQDELDMLSLFYSAGLGEEDPAFIMGLRNVTGKLLTRLRESSAKVERLRKQCQTGGDHGTASAYVSMLNTFLSKWSDELLRALNPAKPFRIKSAALHLLDQLLRSGLDRRFDLVLPTPIQARPWPSAIHLDVIGKTTTSIILRVFQSTYTSLRILAVSILERFPKPLPGYDGDGGVKKVAIELLDPSLKMIRSGREAEASAGAELIALVARTMDQHLWDLSSLGQWKSSKSERASSTGFLSSLMDLLEEQLDAYAADLGRAASTSPIHGTILTLRHLFQALSPHMTVLLQPFFARALAIAERVWDVTKVVLAAQAPEGPMMDGITDHEESRALVIDDGIGSEEDEDEGGEEAFLYEGTRGPRHKVLLSASWRAMKESSALVESLLCIPIERGPELFKAIWSFDSIKHIGDLYATWLALVRHRGAFMAIHPCYSRICAALLKCQFWPDVVALPHIWLSVHLDSIINKKISITRRSAGIPYCILGLLTAVLQTDRSAFDKDLARIFEIAESSTSDILDESRVHAMNTIHTMVLDGKVAFAMAPVIERGFLLAVSRFWSPNWILRNAALMLFASLVTRVFRASKTNLDRTHASLTLRLDINTFFTRYPALHDALRSELNHSIRVHLEDLPSTATHSSLFAVLMLLSLVQTPNAVGTTTSGFSEPFVRLALSCIKSRVWKIRDAAGDALTGIIAPSMVSSTILSLLSDLPSCTQNELHGRLVAAHRLLQGSANLSDSENAQLSAKIIETVPVLLSQENSYPALATFFTIARIQFLRTGTLPPILLANARAQLNFINQQWNQEHSHLPGAENFATGVFLLALSAEPTSTPLIRSGLTSSFLSIQRATLSYLKGDSESIPAPPKELKDQFTEDLLELVSAEQSAPDCRVLAVDLILDSTWTTLGADPPVTLQRMCRIQKATKIIPLREALLPLTVRLLRDVATAESEENTLNLIDSASNVDQSVESREAAAKALHHVKPNLPSALEIDFGRLVQRLVQDDDPTVRSIAEEVVSTRYNGGVQVKDKSAVWLVLETTGPTPLSNFREELAGDIEALSESSSYLFAVEKPNIFRDELSEAEFALETSSTSSSDTVAAVDEALAALYSALKASKRAPGPLGLDGNELVCKWAYRLISLRQLLKSEVTTDEVSYIVAELGRTFI